MKKMIIGSIITGVILFLYFCKKVSSTVEPSLNIQHTYGYIIINETYKDTINISGNPYKISTGREFALNHLYAIKYSLENGEAEFRPENKKKTLINKMNALINMVNTGGIKGAKQKILNDIFPYAKKWVRGDVRCALFRALESSLYGL